MSTHGGLTEDSRSYHRVTHDRKGREGKGVRKGRDVGTACIVSHGSEGARSLAALPSPGDACDEINGGQS